MKEVIAQKIVFDSYGQYLVTKYSDGSIQSQVVSSEFAAQWQAQEGY